MFGYNPSKYAGVTSTPDNGIKVHGSLLSGGAESINQRGLLVGNFRGPDDPEQRDTISVHNGQVIINGWTLGGTSPLAINTDMGQTNDAIWVGDPDGNDAFRVTPHGSPGYWGAPPPTVQAIVATGAGHTVDDIISLLQQYGFCKQT